MKDLNVILPKARAEHLVITGEESLQMVILLYPLVCCAITDTNTCHCSHPLPNKEQMDKPVAHCEFVPQLTAFLLLLAPCNVQATVQGAKQCSYSPVI